MLLLYDYDVPFVSELKRTIRSNDRDWFSDDHVTKYRP